MPKLINKLSTCFVVLFLGILYWVTLSPGLTWAFDGADGGDLITAAITGGVPHPTGYPTYLVLASGILKLPVGTLAFRTNLLSAICTIVAAFLVFQIVRDETGHYQAALVASLGYGAFPLVWSQAIITEVNALNGLFVVLILYLFHRQQPSLSFGILQGAILGLGIGNHVTTIFLIPFMVLDFFIVDGKTPALPVYSSVQRFLHLARQLLGFCSGLCIYLIIPIRASANSPVNWGIATNLDQFVWLTTGQMYRSRLGIWNPSYLYKGLQVWSWFLLNQLNVVGVLLIFIAAVILFRATRLYIMTAWITVVYSAFSILYFSADSYVYLIPVLVSMAIWIGLGVDWINHAITNRFPRIKFVPELLIAMIFLRTLWLIPGMNLSADRDAELYAEKVLMTAPSRAIVFTEGDEATFALWYFHYAYHQRSDLAIVCTDLLAEDWYDRILKYTYPDLMIADTASELQIAHDNPQRRICTTSLDLRNPVVCSP